ncbi:TPA: hypothetical protein ACH3X3_009741 [Trebouxia sp. C0006]
MMQLHMELPLVASRSSLASTSARLTRPVQVHPARSLALPKHKAISQRHVSRIATAAQKSQEGKETAQQVDTKLEEVFDKIEGAEDDIAAGKQEQKTAMEERQKDPRFAEAKDALDLNDKGLTTAAGQQQGQEKK